MSRLLPPQMHVFVRDWLSSNNILLRSPAGHVLVDTGYAKHAPLTLALLRSAHGIGQDALAAIVNTHCHSDHIGGNAALVAKYGCRVALPEGEAELVASWDTKRLLYDYADQAAPRFHGDDVIAAGSVHVWGDLEWQALAAPGHDMTAFVYWNAAHGILISGDALWENGYGFVMPQALQPDALPAARATLDLLASLPVRIVVPGHGEPFVDVAGALDRAYQRTAAFEQDDARVARHALKVLLAFSLLHRERMRSADLADYVERVGIYRDLNAACLRLAPGALAAMLVRELTRAGALVESGGWMMPGTPSPAMAAGLPALPAAAGVPAR